MPTFSPFFALSLRGLVFLLFALPGKNQATAALYSQPEISLEEALRLGADGHKDGHPGFL